MSKWILIIALVLGGVLLWKFGPSMTSGGGSEVSTASGENPFLAHIPADTIIYSGGEYDEALLRATAAFYTFPMMPSQSAELTKALEHFDLGEAPIGQFFESLFNQFMDDPAVTDLVSGMQAAGIALEGHAAFYAHGAIPVLRLTLADSSKLMAKVDKAVADSQLPYTTETLGPATVHLWDVTPEGQTNKDNSIHVVLATQGDLATITTFIGKDDESVRKARLGLTPVANSLASAGTLTALQSQYGYSELSLAFVHVANIANGIADFTANSFGQDLARYIPEEQQADMFKEESAACRKEFAGLFASAPRIVTGYTELKPGADTVSMAGSFVWELNNESVKGELGKVRGHVPSHVLDSKNSFMSFGLGLNSDTMVPALTALWSQFTQAPFTCDQLVKAQAAMKEKNPAMMQMFLGMAQGVQGFGVSLFDIALNAMKMPEQLDLLISIAATTPETIAAMTSMIPLPDLNGIVIPSDGTPVKLNIPMVPPSIEVNAAIKGKHIVVYAGAQAEAAANALTNDTLDPNGVYGMAFNYRKLAGMMDLISQNMNFAGETSCIEAQETLHVFSQLNMDGYILMDFTANGLDMGFAGSIDPPKTNTLKVGGKYALEYLNENCGWEPAGTEEWANDGNGSVQEYYADLGCDTYKATYQWKQQGHKVVFTNHKSETRETCEDEWAPGEDSDEEICHLINADGSTFQCLFDAGTEDAAIYRYTLQ